MIENQNIEGELQRVVEGGAWHGPSLKQNLAGLTAAEAAAHPIAGAHSIWEIVHHLTAWAHEVERRLRERARPLDSEQDWPPVTSTESADWEEAQATLEDAHRRLRQTIRDFPSSRLEESVLGGEEGEPSFYVMLHGLAQHDAYHTGQLAMLRKALVGSAAQQGAAATG